MSNAALCIIWVLRQEDATLSGKVVVLADGAGMTRFGITSAVKPPFDFYTKPAALALQDAIAIYQNQFWNPLAGDQISYVPLAASLLSFAINDGERFVAMHLLQAILGLPQDGVVGPQTIAAIAAQDGPTLLKKLQDAQWNHYQNVMIENPADEQYMDGWRARAYRIYPSLS
jgi:lysozyme family protein